MFPLSVFIYYIEKALYFGILKFAIFENADIGWINTDLWRIREKEFY